MSEKKGFQRGLSRLFGRSGSKSDQRRGSPAPSSRVPESGRPPSNTSSSGAVPTTLALSNTAPANHGVVGSSSGGPTQGPVPTTLAPAAISASKSSSSITRFGLFPFTADLNESQLEQGGADIVAIHGITGDYETTWQWNPEQGGALWLRDFLPEDLPGTRVFSFGYDAKVVFTTSKATLRDFARSLLNRINRLRMGKVCPFQLRNSVCLWRLSANARVSCNHDL